MRQTISSVPYRARKDMRHWLMLEGKESKERKKKED
jgi:hypothetical protein